VIERVNSQKGYNLFETSLEPYQPQVIADILSLLPGDVRSVLDVGCGDGLITNCLPEHIDVTGLDINEESLKKVSRKKVTGRIESLPFPDSSFDLVMANDVLEHLYEDAFKKGLTELARVARKYVLITVPFMENLLYGTTFCGICGNTYHVNGHLRSFDLETLRTLFSKPWRVIEVCFSGQLWISPRSTYVDLLRTLGHYYHCLSSKCPRCGAQASFSGLPDDHSIVKFLSDLEYEYYQNNPFWWRTQFDRSECIVLFEKNGKARKDHPICLRVENEKKILSIHEESVYKIDFANASFARRQCLVENSPWAYYVLTDGEACALPDQCLQVACVAGQKVRIVCSFPVLARQEGIFTLEGFFNGGGSAIVNIAFYDGARASYQYVKTYYITGQFLLECPINSFYPCRYGLLIELTWNFDKEGLLELTTANFRCNDCKVESWPFFKTPAGHVQLEQTIEGVRYSYGILLPQKGNLPIPKWFVEKLFNFENMHQHRYSTDLLREIFYIQLLQQKEKILKEELANAHQEIRKLKEMLEMANVKIAELKNIEAENVLLREKMKQARQQLEGLDNEIKRLKEKLAVADYKDMEFEKCQTENKRLLEQLGKIKQQLEELEKENEEIGLLRERSLAAENELNKLRTIQDELIRLKKRNLWERLIRKYE